MTTKPLIVGVPTPGKVHVPNSLNKKDRKEMQQYFKAKEFLEGYNT